MSKIKKIITGSLEVIAESAKQIGQAVSPGEMVKQAIGQQKSEFTDYLRKLDPNLSGAELEKKKQEIAEKDRQEYEQAQKIIKAAIPPHMRPTQRPPELRPYEKMQKELEQRKVQQTSQAQQAQTQQLAEPTSKQQRGSLFAKKKIAAKGFEGGIKDKKIG